MPFIDSHAHLTEPALIPHLATILERAKKVSISHILNICTDRMSLEAGLDLARRDPSICNAGATTPHDVDRLGEIEFPYFASAAQSGQLCAIGETGLDYHYTHSLKETQQRFLIRYLHLAVKRSLPIIFHCRDAFSDLFAIADAEYTGTAVLHCFTGGMAEAEEVLRRGWYLSLSGIVTFKKSEALRAVAKETPLSQLLIETDTPFLAPQSQRGRINEPAFLPEIAECIAEVKGISVQEVAEATTANAKKIFCFIPNS